MHYLSIMQMSVLPFGREPVDDSGDVGGGEGSGGHDDDVVGPGACVDDKAVARHDADAGDAAGADDDRRGAVAAQQGERCVVECHGCGPCACGYGGAHAITYEGEGHDGRIDDK